MGDLFMVKNWEPGYDIFEMLLNNVDMITSIRDMNLEQTENGLLAMRIRITKLLSFDVSIFASW